MDERISFRLNQNEKAATMRLAKRTGLHKLSAVARMALVEFLHKEGYLKEESEVPPPSEKVKKAKKLPTLSPKTQEEQQPLGLL